MMAFLAQIGSEVIDEDWVTIERAVEFNNEHFLHRPNSQVGYDAMLKNAHQGRIPMRVLDGGSMLFHAPTARTFNGAPIGRPSKKEGPRVALTEEQGKLFRAFRKRFGEEHNDVIYQLAREDGLLTILAYPVVHNRLVSPSRYRIAETPKASKKAAH